MDFKIKYPANESGQEETLSWNEIAGGDGFASLSPGQKAELRQWFMKRAMSSQGLSDEQITPEHIKAFSDHLQAVENPRIAAEQDYLGTIPGMIGNIGNKAPIIDKMLPGAQRVAEDIVEADKPLVERAFPEQTAAFRDLGSKVSDLAAKAVVKGGRLLYDDPVVDKLGGATRFVGQLATELPIQTTSPSGLLTLGSGALEKSLVKTAAETGWRGLTAKAMMGGESGLRAAEGAMLKQEAANIMRASDLPVPAVGKSAAPAPIQPELTGMPTKATDTPKAAVPPKPAAITLDEYHDMLSKHDWYHEMSDDPDVWSKGRDAEKKLDEIAAMSPEHAALKKSFEEHYFSGEPWGTQQSPLPARPQRGALPPGKPEPGAQPTPSAKPKTGPDVGQPARPASRDEIVASDPAIPGHGGETIFDEEGLVKPVRFNEKGKPEIVRRAVSYDALPEEAKKSARSSAQFESRKILEEQSAIRAAADSREAAEASAKKAALEEIRDASSGLEGRVGPRPLTPQVKDSLDAHRANVRAAISGKGVPSGITPKPKATMWHRFVRGYIDPAVDVATFGLKRTYTKIRTMGDRAVREASEDFAPAVDAVRNNIKDPNEKFLFDYLYNLRSMGEEFGISGLDYGGIGSRAKTLIKEMELDLLSAGKHDVWKRVNSAVEQFADATREIGLKRAVSVFGKKRAEELAGKYRYYRSFLENDMEASGLLHGSKEGIKHSIPSMDEYATSFTKGRTGGNMIVGDPLDAFMKSHWRKIVAGKKKEVVDSAVREAMTVYDKNFAEEFAKSGGRGWVKYETLDGKTYVLPEPVADFLKSSDIATANIFADMSKNLFGMARRGYLDLNVRYYSGMVLRDTSDTLLRSRGYLTPQTEWLAKKIGGAAEKIGLGKFQDRAPDIEYLMNPAIWMRAMKSSWRANFSKEGADALFNSLEKMGALQGGSISQLSKTTRAAAMYPQGRMQYVNKVATEVWEGTGRIMKAWDDTLRIAQALRNIPKEMRGKKGWGKVMNLERLPSSGGESLDDMILRVRDTNIDFKMMGEGNRVFKLLNPFINPAMQDKYQTLMYAKEQPVSFALTTAAFMSAAASAYISWKKSPISDKMSPQETQKYIMVDTGIRSGDGNPFVIPAVMIPDSLQGIWAAIRNGIDVASEKDPEFRAIKARNYAKKTAMNVGGSLGNISGPLVAAVETMINKSFYLGRDIEQGYDKSLSAGLRAKRDVPNIYRAMGEGLDRVGLGVSPDRLQYLSRGLLGAPGQAIANMPMVEGLAGKMTSIPREQPAKPKSVSEWLSRTGKGLAKASGVVRELKYDSSYERAMEALGPDLARDSDIRHKLREFGRRIGTESDSGRKKEYLNMALAAYREYLSTLPKGVKPVDINKVLKTAIKDAVKSSVTGESKTLEAMRKRAPEAYRKLGIGIYEEKEEEQLP